MLGDPVYPDIVYLKWRSSEYSLSKVVYGILSLYRYVVRDLVLYRAHVLRKFEHALYLSIQCGFQTSIRSMFLFPLFSLFEQCAVHFAIETREMELWKWLKYLSFLNFDTVWYSFFFKDSRARESFYILLFGKEVFWKWSIKFFKDIVVHKEILVQYAQVSYFGILLHRFIWCINRLLKCYFIFLMLKNWSYAQLNSTEPYFC